MKRDYSVHWFASITLATFIATVASLMTCTMSAPRQAPGDEDLECLTSDRPLVPNHKILMASFNYVDLLKSNGGPWIVVDEDGNNHPVGGNNPTVRSCLANYDSYV